MTQYFGFEKSFHLGDKFFSAQHLSLEVLNVGKLGFHSKSTHVHWRRRLNNNIT